MLQSSGFEKVPYVRPYHTIIVPMAESEEQLRRNLHQKWRNRLTKSEKAGLVIEQGTDGKYLSAFESLYQLTVERKHFTGLDVKVFAKSQQALNEEEKMNFILAYFNGEPVSVHVGSCLGDTGVAIFVAGNDTGLKCDASNLTWWHWFLSARRAGMKNCELGGIDPVANPGVYQFKSRMGGKEVFYIGAYEACTSGLVRGVWHLAEKIYTMTKGRK
jgi:lipid II:glycine glycyltransferase (peptidoglycan interpeptide bridge formation enzyme)